MAADCVTASDVEYAACDTTGCRSDVDGATIAGRFGNGIVSGAVSRAPGGSPFRNVSELTAFRDEKPVGVLLCHCCANALLDAWIFTSNIATAKAEAIVGFRPAKECIGATFAERKATFVCNA